MIMVCNREIALLMIQSSCLDHIPWSEQTQISLTDILSTSISMEDYNSYSEEEYNLLKSGVDKINNDWKYNYKILLIIKDANRIKN